MSDNIVESVYLQANTDVGLAFLWEVGAPEKLRKG